MAADLAAARLNMVESQVRTQDVTDVRIHDAMRQIARESMLPSENAYLAYADVDAPYAPGRFLMRPRNVSKLLQALKPAAGERALAIAAPYAAAVLEHMGLQVDRLDGEDLRAVTGSGYDVVICEGAVFKAPETWLAALSEDGRLAVVERDGPVGRAAIYRRADGGFGRSAIFDATPPVLPGFVPEAGFAF
jgi:protein-L-isoaspartate(D-aspartate) O-methyltransferase